MRRVLLTIAILAVPTLTAAQPKPVFDVNCGSAPTTGGVATEVRIERGPGTDGPFVQVGPAIPLPVTWPYVDRTVTSGQSVSYRCVWANAAGAGVASLASDPQVPLVVPGQGGKPTVIIRFE
jgi:hypothetical protein